MFKYEFTLNQLNLLHIVFYKYKRCGTNFDVLVQ